MRWAQEQGGICARGSAHFAPARGAKKPAPTGAGLQMPPSYFVDISKLLKI